jgi:hypothetical protein
MQGLKPLSSEQLLASRLPSLRQRLCEVGVCRYCLTLRSVPTYNTVYPSIEYFVIEQRTFDACMQLSGRGLNSSVETAGHQAWFMIAQTSRR